MACNCQPGCGIHLYVSSFIPHYGHLRIECNLLKFHWGMKALTEVHFQ
jgi:hypothetical protein